MRPIVQVRSPEERPSPIASCSMRLLATLCLTASLGACGVTPTGEATWTPAALGPELTNAPRNAATETSTTAPPNAAVRASRQAQRVRSGDQRSSGTVQRSASGGGEKRQARVASAVSTSAPPAPPGIQPEVRRFVDAVDFIVKTLDATNAAFNPPKAMAAREKRSIEIVLPLQALAREPGQPNGLRNKHAMSRPRVGDLIEARLHAENFEITPLMPEGRLLGAADEIRWRWQVTPLQEGHQRLHVTVSILADVAGQRISRTETFGRTTVVAAVPWSKQAYGFAKEHWAWLWAAVIVPLAGWAGGKQPKPPPFWATLGRNARLWLRHHRRTGA